MTDKKLIILQLLLVLFLKTLPGQVSIRLYTRSPAVSGVFTATVGKYELDVYDGKSLPLTSGEPVILATFNNRIAVKMKNSQSFMCDSLILKGLTGNDRFYFRINGNTHYRQYYGGDLKCYPDLGILVFMNICDIDQYLTGVVRTEGGPGRNIEYLKSQTVLARTFMYKNFNRHALDRYNLCDDIHCQAFQGISYDTLINRAVRETRNLVIIEKDSSLIISAFHSNCGGETSASEDVWLSSHTYLNKIRDPYCLHSPNTAWRKSIPLSEWEAYLKKSGFTFEKNDPPSYNFSQLTRQNNYRIADFSIPFRQIRDDLNLRSAFFSVQKQGNSIVLKGRGYGHGVGLCQEGAMVMSAKGFKFNEIIGFYYTGVLITDVKNAKIKRNDL